VKIALAARRGSCAKGPGWGKSAHLFLNNHQPRIGIPLDAIPEDLDNLVGQGGDVLGDEVEGDAGFEAVGIGVGDTPGVVALEGLLAGLAHDGDDLARRQGNGGRDSSSSRLLVLVLVLVLVQVWLWLWLWLLRRRHHSPGGHGSERLWHRWWSLPLHLFNPDNDSTATSHRDRFPTGPDPQKG
jgi:hypothetical protein